MITRYQKMWLRRGLVPFISAVILILLVLPAESRTVTVYTEPLAPLHYEKEGQVVGIATEVVSAIFKVAGNEAHFEMYPWKRAYQFVLTNRDTFVYTINRTKKREGLFQWIGPIMNKRTSLYKLKSRTDITITGYEDVRRYTTAVILGHSLTTRLRDMGFREGIELITAPDKKAQIRLFLNGRTDLVTGNQYTLPEALLGTGYSMEDVEPVLLVSDQGYYLAANINTDPQLVKKLREANARVQTSGLVEMIVAQYRR